MEKNETNRETLLSHSLCDDDENDAFVLHDSDDEGIERIHESSSFAIREKSLFVVVVVVVVILRWDDDENDDDDDDDEGREKSG